MTKKHQSQPEKPSSQTPSTVEEVVVSLMKAIVATKSPSPKTGKIGKGVFHRHLGDLLKLKYGEDFDTRAATDALLEAGVLEGHPSKGGFTFYLKGDMPVSSNTVDPKTIFALAGLDFPSR